MCWTLDFGTLGLLCVWNVWTLRLLDSWTFGLWEFWLWDCGTFGLWEFWTSGLLDFVGLWAFGTLWDFGIVGLWDFGTLRLCDFWILGLWDHTNSVFNFHVLYVLTMNYHLLILEIRLVDFGSLGCLTLGL
jgi:hypothetical protein